MFFGNYDYKIDQKGRVPMPPAFRRAFQDGVVLHQGVEKCIVIYTPEDWGKATEKYTGPSFARDKMRRLKRILFANTFNLELDKLGRITIPANMRQYARLEDDVIITGNGSYLELWNTKSWNEENAIMAQEAWQIFESTEAD